MLFSVGKDVGGSLSLRLQETVGKALCSVAGNAHGRRSDCVRSSICLPGSRGTISGHLPREPLPSCSSAAQSAGPCPTELPLPRLQKENNSVFRVPFSAAFSLPRFGFRNRPGKGPLQAGWSQHHLGHVPPVGTGRQARRDWVQPGIPIREQSLPTLILVSPRSPGILCLTMQCSCPRELAPQAVASFQDSWQLCNCSK